MSFGGYFSMSCNSPARSKWNSRSVGKCLPVNGKKDCWEIVFKEDFKK